MVTLAIGERGEGKTTIARYLAKQRSSVELIFEPKVDGAVSDCEFVFTDTELYEALQKAKDKGKASICFVPSDDIQDGFSEFIDVIKSPNPKIGYCFGGVSIVIDEAWSLMTPKSSHPELERLLRIAPRNGEHEINVTVLGHRAVDINERTHFFSDELFIFRTTEVNELETLDRRWHPSISQVVSSFPDGEHYCVQYNKNSRKLTVWDKPEKWKPKK
jgi:AAA domain